MSEGHPNVEVAHFSTNVAPPSWWRQVRGDLGNLEGVALTIAEHVFEDDSHPIRFP